jgi:hypothetical protein
MTNEKDDVNQWKLRAEFILDSIYAKNLKLGMQIYTNHSDEWCYWWHPDYCEFDEILFKRNIENS